MDDFHSIKEKRHPNTTTTSEVTHMATCVCKPVACCPQIPIFSNGTSVHNPAFVDRHNVALHLIQKYHGVFDISYTERKMHWLQEKNTNLNNFEKIELLTVHMYDCDIAEKREERSMGGLQLVDIREMSLHSMQDYLDALEVIIAFDKETQCLANKVAPVVADWPGQLFIRKAVTQLLHGTERGIQISPQILSFIPIIGPLHLSLNSREQTVLVYYGFFEQLFHQVFGNRKVLAKKPKPWRINLLLELAYSGWLKIRTVIMSKFGTICKDVEYRMAIDLLDNVIPSVLDIYAILFRSGSFEHYVETVFRIWTLAFRWKRRNYNKAPLVFLSDIFYWQDTAHPMAQAIKNYLVSFSDYPVENMHSRIRTNIPKGANGNVIKKQACVVGKLNSCMFTAYQN